MAYYHRRWGDNVCCMLVTPLSKHSVDHRSLRQASQYCKMIRHETQVQDENAGVTTERHLEGKRIHGTPMAKHASSDGRQRGLGISRKALGDVSNNGSLLTQLKGQQTAGRRALGDITNATPQQRSQRPVQAKASGQAETVAGVTYAAVSLLSTWDIPTYERLIFCIWACQA